MPIQGSGGSPRGGPPFGFGSRAISSKLNVQGSGGIERMRDLPVRPATWAVTIVAACASGGAVYMPVFATVPADAENSAGDSFTKRPAESKSRTLKASGSPAAICASAGTTCTHAGSPAGPCVAAATAWERSGATLADEDFSAACVPRQ